MITPSIPERKWVDDLMLVSWGEWEILLPMLECLLCEGLGVREDDGLDLSLSPSWGELVLGGVSGKREPPRPPKTANIKLSIARRSLQGGNNIIGLKNHSENQLSNVVGGLGECDESSLLCKHWLYFNWLLKQNILDERNACTMTHWMIMPFSMLFSQPTHKWQLQGLRKGRSFYSRIYNITPYAGRTCESILSTLEIWFTGNIATNLYHHRYRQCCHSDECCHFFWEEMEMRGGSMERKLVTSLADQRQIVRSE